MATSSKDRMARMRARLKKADFVQVTVTCHRDDAQLVRRHAQKLKEKRNADK